MKLPKLTKDEKNMVQDWLNCNDETRCPFEETSGVYECEKICDVAFQRCTKKSCPCRVYTKPYVVRIARRMVKDTRAKRGKK